MQFYSLDGTMYDSTSYIGRKFVGIFNGTDHEETLAFIFAAEFSDDLVVEVAVHPQACDVDAQEAEILASIYSEVLGRVPRIFRNNITNFHLRPGKKGCKVVMKSKKLKIKQRRYCSA